MISPDCHPIALDREVLPASLVRALYLGVRIVLWRSRDGAVHVWEDRCPHRGVRLSAGRNLGDCLEGADHGWRFAPDGSVASIPAEGNRARPDIRVGVLPSLSCGGLIWVTRGERPAAAPGFSPETSEVLTRPIFIGKAAEHVSPLLSRLSGHRLVATPTTENGCVLLGFVLREGGKSEIETLRRSSRELNVFRRRVESGSTR